MLFSFLKFPARLALKIYCRSLQVNRPEILQMKGPLLIAANHPNSFLDAIILATIFKKPIYSLARGDAFAGGFISKLLYGMNILPVYRISEGAHNLNNNYDTFSKCRDIFRQDGIVLIFSEGLCVNEWKLRALKKGTARLTMDSWAEGIDLKILPTGINYHSFLSFGKHVHINFGNIITKEQMGATDNGGLFIKTFNEQLKEALLPLVDHFDENDQASIRNKYVRNKSSNALTALPALLGKWLHAPLYIPVRNISLKKAAPFCHHDSVVVGLLFLLYPIYLLIVSGLVYFAVGEWFWLLPFIFMPLLAWTFVQYKKD